MDFGIFFLVLSLKGFIIISGGIYKLYGNFLLNYSLADESLCVIIIGQNIPSYSFHSRQLFNLITTF